jgi:sulfur carrier protein ThiS
MNITRRAALKGGTATVAAIAVTGAVSARIAVATDPVIVLRSQREQGIAAINACPNTFEGDDVASEISSNLVEIEALIIETEPQTLAGVLAQVEQLALWHQGGLTYRGDETIEPLLKALPERIERLAGRVSS